MLHFYRLSTWSHKLSQIYFIPQYGADVSKSSFPVSKNWITDTISNTLYSIQPIKNITNNLLAVSDDVLQIYWIYAIKSAIFCLIGSIQIFTSLNF